MSIKTSIAFVLRHPVKMCRRLIYYPWYKLAFKKFSRSDEVRSVRYITCGCVSLGRRVSIGPNARIQGIKKYNSESYNPQIIIGDGVSIQQNLHLTCANRVAIGNYAAIAANVTITDIEHPYEDVSMPIEAQDLIVKDVEIGPETKIYNGAVILPGVHIGRHCVVGANSVVRRDLPDYSVAVGLPARIVRRYDAESQRWRRTDDDGHFIK